MRRIVLKRISSNPNVTFGVLTNAVTGLPICVTIEKPWKNNTQYISCIPKGIYRCKPIVSRKFGEVYEITDVPNRSHILFHIANTEAELKGCIGLGTKYGYLDDKPAVLESKIALNYFKKHIGKNEFLLEVL
jgi:hypothetical protein